MNVIIAYLESMFSTYPQTPRLLEAKAELQGMMEDAYTSLITGGASENEAIGQVIRDFGNLEEVAPVLGIIADIAPAGAADQQPIHAPNYQPGEQAPNQSAYAAPMHPPVTLDEARGYVEGQRRIRGRLTAAVVLFVLSPAVLLALPSAATSGVVDLASSTGAFIGILALLVLVAVGVILIVTTSRDTGPYRRITEGRFTVNPEATRFVEALAERNEGARVRALQIAVALWILAPLPLIAAALLLGGTPHGNFWSVLGVVLVLVMVAAGLAVLLPKTWAHTAAEQIRRGKSSGANATANEHSIVGVIASFYWPLLVAIYLAWSFIGDAWRYSWVLWPIGAVLFGAIAAGGGALESYRRARR